MDQATRSPSNLSAEERYRLLVDAVTDYAIYMIDPDGRVASWNSGAERLKGYSAAEIIGSHFSVFYLPEDVQAGVPVRALQTAAHEGRFETEGWRRRKDGSRFWAQVLIRPIRAAGGELVGYAKVTRDLSERKEAEDALRNSEQQFRLLVQAVTDYAIYMLDANGIVTNWNAGARRAKGYEPSEVIGTHFSRFYRAEDRERGLPAKALATAAAEGRFEGEGWRVRKDGTEFWANVVIDPIVASDGSLIGFAKVTRDITDKRKARIALEQAREALFQAQKLDAIGQLTGGVAHDFNNLLTVILTSLELLRRRLPADDKLLRLVDNATSGAQRGVSLTQRMLAFARRQDLRPVPVDVPALVAGMKELMERTLGPTIHIEQDFAAGLQPVLIDPHQLELAVLNLAVNARDAMPQGGRLDFSGSELSVAAGEDLAPGRYLRFVVGDSGSGMDAETLARALEPFFTTKGVGKGTGLGLAMVHGLAVQSGGRFVLESSEGVGTNAILWLPLAPEDLASAPVPLATASTPAPAADEAAAGASLLVLVVDDDPLVLAGTASVLEVLGHSVLCAASGEEALRLLRGEPRIGLVISDQVMPGMSGVQLFEQLRRERPALPLILASGFAELGVDVDLAAIKLDKPFDMKQLARAIAAALAARGG